MKTRSKQPRQIARVSCVAAGNRYAGIRKTRGYTWPSPPDPFTKRHAVNVPECGRSRCGQVSEALLSLSEASVRSGLSTSRLRRLAAADVLHARKAGSYWVVTEAALEDLMRMPRPRGVKAGARPGQAEKLA